MARLRPPAESPVLRKQRLSPVFAALPTPVFAWERAGDDLVLVDYNAAAEQQTSGRVAQLVGRRARETYATQPHVVRDLEAALQQEVPMRREVDYTLLSTGASRRLQVTYVRAEADLVLAVTEDITEHRYTQRALAESEQNYRRLVEEAPDGIVVHRDGVVVYVNDAFVRLVGARSAEAVVGTPVLSHVHPDDRDQVSARVHTVRDGGAVPIAEERLIRADGGVVYAEIAGIPTTYDGKPAVLAIARDVGERRKAQALFKALSEQSLAGITVWQDEKLVYVNRRCAELFGYAPEELIGGPVERILAPGARETVVGMLRHRVRQGYGDVHYTFSGLRKDGTTTDIEVYSAIIELDGRWACVGTLLDASERERLSQELRQAQKMEAVGQLAGGIAHDFNNILTAIISYADLAIADLPQENQVRLDVAEIRAAGLRAAALTRQLLAFSRRQTLEPRVVNVNDVVLPMTNMLRRLIGERITLDIEPGNELPRVLADPGQLEQVLLNLVVNARDVMPDGGGLVISTRAETVGEEQGSTHPGLAPGPYVAIRVRDTGPGIPEHVIGRIFEPFFTTKPAGKGTGLGLSVVYGIVKQTGGSVSVERTSAEGTTFTVLLPAMAADGSG
jgi:PAS domain S-box-containing protein